MCSLLLRLEVTIITFMIGIVGTLLTGSLLMPAETTSDKNPKVRANLLPSDAIELSFCRVVSEPEVFEDKTVLIVGDMTLSNHGTRLSGDGCITSQYETFLSMNSTIFEELELKRHEAEQTFYKTEGYYSRLPFYQIVATGKLKRNHPTYNDNTYGARMNWEFELLKIEKVTQQKYPLPKSN